MLGFDRVGVSCAEAEGERTLPERRDLMETADEDNASTEVTDIVSSVGD